MKMFSMGVAVLSSMMMCGSQLAAAQNAAPSTQRVVIENDGWELVGDLRLPSTPGPVPAVLMLNRADGTRQDYTELAELLAARGVASLRLDLRGHGESTNRGRFVPGEVTPSPLIWDSESDVIAAHEYLRRHPDLDGSRLGFIGASYSGEEAAEAGRTHGYASAYVLLSPGSLSDESIQAMDQSGVPWLFVAARNERFLSEISATVQAETSLVELAFVPGTGHATDFLVGVGGMTERIAVWLAYALLGQD